MAERTKAKGTVIEGKDKGAGADVEKVTSIETKDRDSEVTKMWRTVTENRKQTQ